MSHNDFESAAGIAEDIKTALVSLQEEITYDFEDMTKNYKAQLNDVLSDITDAISKIDSGIGDLE